MVLLHACAHNPTGVDPTAEEWKVPCCAVQRADTTAICWEVAGGAWSCLMLEHDADKWW